MEYKILVPGTVVRTQFGEELIIVRHDGGRKYLAADHNFIYSVLHGEDNTKYVTMPDERIT